MINFFKKNYTYILVIIFALAIRFWDLSSIPSALYYDEIDLGYQVRSLMQTGRDYRGQLSPFYFRSFNTDKTPLPIWFSAPASLFFSSPELQVRAGTALAGVLVVVVGMSISKLLFVEQSTTTITGIVLAFSPWLIHFSRLAFEAQFALLFSFAYFYYFLFWQKTKQTKYLYFSAVVLGLSVYTYRTMSLLSLLYGLASLIVFYKSILKLGLKKIITVILIFSFFYVPFIYATTIGAKDQTRISQISIFSDPTIPIEVQRSRELVSGNYQNSALGQSASLQSKIFHNKLLSFFDRFANNTLNNFSPDFLFLKGDGNGRHSAKNTGELLLTDIVGLITGIIYIVNNKKNKKLIFLGLATIFSAIPANLTLDGANHASRLISFAGLLLLIISVGYSQVFNYFCKLKLSKIYTVSLTVIWLFLFGRFVNTYFYQFPVINSREFGFGYKQVIEKVEKIKDGFDKVYISGVNDPPMLYYFFWSNTDPRLVQDYGTEYGDNVIKNSPLDKIKPFYPTDLLCKEKQIESLLANTLYVVDYRSLPLDFRSADKDKVPQGIKLLDVIKYPDNEVAYYLITRDSIGDKLIAPAKGQTCN